MTKTSALSSSAQPHRDPRSEVRFENARFDPDLTPFHDLAKQMAAWFGYSAELSLDPRLAELINMNVWTRLKLAQGAMPAEDATPSASDQSE
jgi:hypothetical protein